MPKLVGPTPFAKTYVLDNLSKRAGVTEITSAPAVSFDNVPVGEGLEGKVKGVEWRMNKKERNPCLIMQHESGADFAMGINVVTATAMEKLKCTFPAKEDKEKVLPNIEPIMGKYLLVVNLGKLEDKKYHNLRVFCGDKSFETAPAPTTVAKK